MKFQTINIPCYWVVLLLIIVGISSAKASTLVTFKGNLIGNPPCDITGDNDPITVDFDEVGITRIDGVNYMQDFALTVTCGNDLGNAVQLYMGYDGMNAPFDDNAIQTSLRGLGVRLYYQGDVVAPNNDDIPIVMSSGGVANIPLSAVPVKDPTIDLFEGTFTATGTVEIRYP